MANSFGFHPKEWGFESPTGYQLLRIRIILKMSQWRNWHHSPDSQSGDA